MDGLGIVPIDPNRILAARGNFDSVAKPEGKRPVTLVLAVCDVPEGDRQRVSLIENESRARCAMRRRRGPRRLRSDLIFSFVNCSI